MIDRYDSIMAVMNNMDEKLQKRLKPQVLANINKKILDVADLEDDQQFHQLYQQLRDIVDGLSTDLKAYKKGFAMYQKSIRRKYDFVEKGTIKSEITGIGIALGVAFGGAFLSIGPAYTGIGIPIGLAIGVAIGTQKEKEAEEQGKLY